MGPHRYDLDPIRATQKEREVVALILDGKMREARGQALILCVAVMLLTPVAMVGMVGGVCMAIVATLGPGNRAEIQFSDTLTATIAFVWLVFAFDQLVLLQNGRGKRTVLLSATLGSLLLVYFSDRAATSQLWFFLGFVPLAMAVFGLMGYHYTGVLEPYINKASETYEPYEAFHLSTYSAGLLFWGYTEAVKQAWLCLGLRRDDMLHAADILYATANRNRRALQTLLDRVGEMRMKRMITTLEKLKLLYLGKKDLVLTNDGEIALGLRQPKYE